MNDFTDHNITGEDIAQLEALVHAYGHAWQANDAEAVMRLFMDDAVVMPHHGATPRVGAEAIRAFWFPAEGSSTSVISMCSAVDEVGGSGDLGFVRGRFEMRYVTLLEGIEQTVTNAGTFLTLARRQVDGSWRFSHRMWDDPVPQMA